MEPPKTDWTPKTQKHFVAYAILHFSKTSVSFKSSSAVVAQLDRVSGYEPEGRGFESCLPHHLIKKPSMQKHRRLYLCRATVFRASGDCRRPWREASDFFLVFFAFSLLACYAFTPDVRGSTEMTNPIRRQIQEHPACDTHRPRSHAEGFLRRSGREVECTPLLRVQVRIRASGVRIPPSPPVSEQGSGLSSEPCFFHEKDESKARKNPCGPKSHHERFAGTKPSSPHRDLRRTRISS